jgi:hypothetical protein
MLNESTETWDNGGARLVLLAPPAPLTTPLLKGAIGMATSNRTRAPWKNKWTHWRVRFWLYVLKTDQCWLWQGAHTAPRGYGTMRVGGRSQRAHRIAYEMEHGPISPGLSVCHHCDNPACVRPSHLFLGTHQENMRDCIAKGRSCLRPRPRVYTTHCKNGHPLSGDNLCRATRGDRICLACARARMRTRRRTA